MNGGHNFQHDTDEREILCVSCRLKLARYNTIYLWYQSQENKMDVPIDLDCELRKINMVISE